MIYSIGNSHAHFFTGTPPGTQGFGSSQNEYFTSISLGPVIAYNFFEHHYPILLNALSQNQIKIQTGDKILLTIGEVDCRWHLPKRANDHKQCVNDVVHECVDRFFRTHIDLKQRGYDVIGWGGHPTTNDGHNDNQDCPIFGDVLYRNEISKEWSSYLESKCLWNGISFVSIIDDLISIDGTTKMEYYIDYCHLKTESLLGHVVNKFKEKRLC
jgi:hypothetical protein